MTTAMRLPDSIHTLRRSAGFNLIELAIVLLILGILMSGVIGALGETTGTARRSATLAQLRQIEDALYGFAQSQGRLPCPATVASNGYEDGSSGACAVGDGLIPNATLGLYGQVDSNGVLVDSWQSPIRYAVVRSGGAGNPDFTSANAIRTFFGLGTPITGTFPMLRICSAISGGSCSPADVIVDTAPAVIYSMGANWSSYTSLNEAENADGDTVFVSAGYSEEQFDDQLVWLSPYVLFNRMISAGKVP